MSQKRNSYAALLYLPRQRGHTSALIPGAVANGALIITADERHAVQLRKAHGVDAMSLGTAASAGGLMGCDVPVVFDHHAVSAIIAEYEAQIDRLLDLAP